MQEEQNRLFYVTTSIEAKKNYINTMKDPLINASTNWVATTPSCKKESESSFVSASFSENNEGTKEHDEQQKPAVNGGGNIFSKLFQRKENKEVDHLIENCALDSLSSTGRPATDESDTTTQEDESSSCAYSQDGQKSHDEMNDDNDDSDDRASNCSDDENSDSGEDNEISEEDEESVESFHEDSRYQKGRANTLQDAVDSLDDDFGDFYQSIHETNNSTEGGELYSLIAGTKGDIDARIGMGNTGTRLGSSLSNFFGINQKQEQQQKEKQSLLMGNCTDDENDSRRSDGTDGDGLHVRCSEEKYADFKEGNDFENQSAYHDDDDDDDLSETGEYRLECFYPGIDPNGQMISEEGSHSESRDLHGRIHGFGNESSTMHQGRNFDLDPGRPFFADSMTDIPMTPMNTEASEERGFFTGVGKAMNSITGFIRQQREGGESIDKNRRRMLDYIHELEHSLGQKEKELHLWKERAEHLQLEVNRLQGSGTDDDEEEEEVLTDSDEDTEAEDNNEEMAKAGSTLIKLNRCKTDDTVPEEEEEEKRTTEKVGILIDICPKPLVFDPLAVPTRNQHQQY